MLFTLPNGFTAERVSEALAKTVMRLPASLRRSLTWDQGPEMAGHVGFTIDTGLAVYFCDPRSPWQRGSNENTNGLLRQYFPKGRSLAGVTQRELDRVADQLNGRPRQTLGWRSPAQKLTEFMAESSAASGATTA
jgi:IS30 family transposase